ncbi:hypothetical protein ACFCXT_22885 [Streptomyces vinaceus]|uniref:hypothetical protein n=1 Tax=Streptomyces vinaceus TaxID=1960 RepID=UPI0035E108AE
MSNTNEQPPSHLACIATGLPEAHQPLACTLLVVILILVLMGTPAGDVTALVTAASLLIAQVSSGLNRDA